RTTLVAATALRAPRHGSRTASRAARTTTTSTKSSSALRALQLHSKLQRPQQMSDCDREAS
ncbi:MAG: hypothetical protein KME13_24990, partial [Myxacorys californica WJT36-NPBG1]|nr:hypothetical protein [Myxacorys californica WJT36-NPBG1]